MAYDLHAGQFRKGTEIPYVSHLFLVCGTVLDFGGSEDAAIAALLHDAVEDQGGLATLQRIESEFGSEVARIVRSCSDSMETPKRPWRERKQQHLEQLASAPDDVILVSISDKLYNVRAILRDYRQIGDALWARFNAGPDQILSHYRGLVAVLRSAGAHLALLTELDQTVSALESAVRHRQQLSR